MGLFMRHSRRHALLFVLLALSTVPRQAWTADATGKFWQVTDFHYDPRYSTRGDTSQMCHDVGKTSSPAPGVFGDYACDAPWRLVEEAVQAMARIESAPDFILWTGDDPPHVPVDTLNFSLVLGTVVNCTQLIRKHFPNTHVLPVLGNHDYYPKGQMPPNGNDFYTAVAKEWARDLWIPFGEASSTFTSYGYYTMTIPGVPGLRFVCLNTVYYYHQDKVTENMTDPGGQLAWFDDVMEQARANQEKVYVFGHVPPGMFERKANVSWFYPHYNSLFIEALINHSDIIAGQFFAHQHADSFKVFYSDCDTKTGECKTSRTSMFLAPSVTPWKTSLPGVSAQNPAIRVYEYDKKTLTVTNIRQYHADISAANKNGKIDWQLGYSATDDFGLVDLSTDSLDCLTQSFRSSNSHSYSLYYKHTTAGFVNNSVCDESCKRTQICSITRADYNEYYNCQKGTPAWPTTTRSCSANYRHHSSSAIPLYGYILIGLAVSTIVIHAVIVVVVRMRKKKARTGTYQPLLNADQV